MVDGTCDEAFRGVRQAFEQNFEQGDLGASCAVTVDGELVVDLWGGHRDLARKLPWERDTIVNVWSTTKMFTSMCVLMLHDRGEISLDAPMADYWAEFAANGKEGVLVRHVMSHTAGLSTFDTPISDLDEFDWDACCARLASQPPRWTPGDGSGYHAETRGWLLGELIRRVDGRTMGSFFREEVAEPLGIDAHVGLADEEFHRVADMSTHEARPYSTATDEHGRLHQAGSIRNLGLVNTASFRRVEKPSSNGHTNARAVALAMAPLANGGSAGGRMFVGPTTIDRIFEVQADGVDRTLGTPIRFGIGYGLNSEATPLGVNDRTFWWAGWGGSMCVVDVENRLTVAYTMNKMAGDNDTRAAMIVMAAHGSRASF